MIKVTEIHAQLHRSTTNWHSLNYFQSASTLSTPYLAGWISVLTVESKNLITFYTLRESWDTKHLKFTKNSVNSLKINIRGERVRCVLFKSLCPGWSPLYSLPGDDENVALCPAIDIPGNICCKLKQKLKHPAQLFSGCRLGSYTNILQLAGKQRDGETKMAFL